jgi:hypothetical protein
METVAVDLSSLDSESIISVAGPSDALRTQTAFAGSSTARLCRFNHPESALTGQGSRLLLESQYLRPGLLCDVHDNSLIVYSMSISVHAW